MLNASKIMTAKNYREYLNVYFDKKRKESSKYSIRFYSARIKTSDSYLKHVLSGKRALTAERALDLCKSLGIRGLERTYFVTMVLRDEADTTALQTFYNRQLIQLRTLDVAYETKSDHDSIFSDSILWEIYTLISVKDFRNDPHWIASKLKRKDINSTIAKKAMDKLTELGAIKEDGNGKIVAKDLIVKDKKSIRSAYRAALNRAVKHLEVESLEKDYFDSFCLVLSDEEYLEIEAMLIRVKAQIIKLAKRKDSSLENKNRTAFLNLNLFWTSN